MIPLPPPTMTGSGNKTSKVYDIFSFPVLAPDLAPNFFLLNVRMTVNDSGIVLNSDTCTRTVITHRVIKKN